MHLLVLLLETTGHLRHLLRWRGAGAGAVINQYVARHKASYRNALYALYVIVNRAGAGRRPGWVIPEAMATITETDVWRAAVFDILAPC